MKLTETMSFLSPAIDKKNKLNPVLDHICITRGYAIAYNGMLAMAAPVPLSLECAPNGALLEQAVKRFGDEFSATQKANGDLFFRGNGFSVNIPCTTDSFPMPSFDSTPIMAGTGFVDKLKKLLPFTNADDDNNPWMGGVLLRDGKAVATCGHSIAWCEVDIPTGIDILIPVEVVEAMVQIKEEPEYIAKGEDKFVAVYSGGRFVASPLIHTTWPSLVNIISKVEIGQIPTDFFKQAKAIEPFGTGAMRDLFYIFDDCVASHRDGSGARADVLGLVGSWELCHSSLKLIERHAKLLNLNTKLGRWAGEGIEGAIRLREIKG